MSNEKQSMQNRPPRVRRSRSFSLTSYLSPLQIASVLQRHDKQIRAYAYILHDKDLNEDLTPKELHCHILLQLVNANTVDGVRKWFKGFEDSNGQQINTLCQVMHDITSSYDYLTHNTEQAKADGKYLYPESSVICSDKAFFEGNSEQAEDNINLALGELLDGIPLKEVALKYGRDFIIHYQSIKLLFNDIQSMEGGKFLGLQNCRNQQ